MKESCCLITLRRANYLSADLNVCENDKINDQIRRVVTNFNALFRYSPQGTKETTQEIPFDSSQFFPWFLSGSFKMTRRVILSQSMKMASSKPQNVL